MAKNTKTKNGATVPADTLKIGDVIILDDGDSAVLTSIGSIDHVVTENIRVCVLGYKYTTGKREGMSYSSPVRGDDDVVIYRSKWDVMKAVGRAIAGRWHNQEQPTVKVSSGFIPSI